MPNPTELTALDAAREIANGRLTSEELVRAYLDRIEARDDAVRAWVHLDPEQALAEARARDAERPRSPLHGVPVGVKDILDTHDMPTTHGSPIYPDNRPSHDAACVALLRDAGLVMMGGDHGLTLFFMVSPASMWALYSASSLSKSASAFSMVDPDAACRFAEALYSALCACARGSSCWISHGIHPSMGVPA